MHAHTCTLWVSPHRPGPSFGTDSAQRIFLHAVPWVQTIGLSPVLCALRPQRRETCTLATWAIHTFTVTERKEDGKKPEVHLTATILFKNRKDFNHSCMRHQPRKSQPSGPFRCTFNNPWRRTLEGARCICTQALGFSQENLLTRSQLNPLEYRSISINQFPLTK